MTRRPSLLFVNQHYWPDVAATGQHLTDLAEYLAADGFDVTVWCSRGRYVGGDLRAPAREERTGVRIRRLPATGFGRGHLAGRAADYVSFYLQVFARLTVSARFDRVIFLTTPSILSFVGWLVHRIRGQPYAVWSMDLHPEIEEALGIFRPGRPFTRLLHAMSRAGDRGADFIVCLGPWMKRRLLEKGIPESRLRMIPVWSCGDEIRPVPAERNPLARELGFESRFVVMYSGNAGLAHRFDEVLGAMRLLRDDPGFFFLFIGDGPGRPEIERFARRHDLRHFRYLDYFPRDRLHHSLSLGDVHLLTLREEMAGLAVPAKLYGIMAAGRPVVMVGPRGSEPGATILAERAGIVIDPALEPDSVSALVAALRALRERYEPRDQLGGAAREAFLARYERTVCCAAWRDLLRSSPEGEPAEPQRPDRVGGSMTGDRLAAGA